VIRLQHVTHGQTIGGKDTRVYRVWAAMIYRCTNPRDKHWKDYGGRGITVCDRWRKFENFYADMGGPPPGLSIDRLNNDGNYCKENCAWRTAAEQAKNKRRGNAAISARDRTRIKNH
jgi:hypothetical protein